ncbi:sulfatase-like hydrolase/transferase [Halomicroarcula sp. F28]|uniref:sulfatase-like hydrolase/transferase n=1 Tax=Haloarcula salinisoli TaxID=2487746 RepID=UPI001C72B54B|nr:sulfatase-like hydrolase/transferase [Halomicroarcula salinisoli]MBX0288395.1 sulfatase-like hydrolase/transferase [Halomicroarcula salinisoli]
MTDRDSIVWITLESIRYDHTSLSGYERDTTPSLSSIGSAPSGNTFHQCISHGNWTGTSSASILTGTTPPTHGIYGESELVIADDIATVPELLPDSYESLSLVSNPNAGPARGLDRGFDDVKYIVPSRLREDVGLQTMVKSVPKLWKHGGGLTFDIERHKGLSSFMTVDLAREFVASQDDPYFMYIHLGSSHHPYLPPSAFVDQFVDELSVTTDQALDIAQSKYEDIHELIASGGLSATELEIVEAMYDATLAHVDYCVEQIYDAVRQRDDEPTLVITADHGDLLGERDLAGHKFLLDDALTHVPLVTYNLDGVDARTDEVVQHGDVIKTALAQAGVTSEQLEGVDLRSDSREFAVTQRSGSNAQQNIEQIHSHDPAFEPPVRHPKMLTAFRSIEHKLLYSEDEVELFVLPDETTDMKEQHPEVCERMVSQAREWLDEHETRPAAERDHELDSSIKQHLSDMGYIV